MSFIDRFRKTSNSKFTSTKTILEQMNEPRPLPMGVAEFKEWSDRIISGALIPTSDRESLVATLAVMIQQLGPQESHKPDAYFIHSLRKAAANEVSRHLFTEIKTKRDAEYQAKVAATAESDLVAKDAEKIAAIKANQEAVSAKVAAKQSAKTSTTPSVG